jgi:hypothetical protein
MDTSQQRAVIPRDKEVSVAPLRQRSIAEKRRIVEETLAPTLPGRETWGTEAGDQVAAGTGERE